MAGWSHEKRTKVEAAFYQFLNRCYVNSKDAGRICLGEHLYDGQRRFITAVFDSLEADIHKIFVLKSRQLGLSTIARALAIFLLGIHPGLKGAIVFDTDQNKQESRAEIEVMINDLPKSLKFSGIKGNNRTGLTLGNDSKVLFFSAGVRKSKTSGTLGRSVGLSLAHLSELCSYDNEEGLEAFEQSLSEVNPDRLYIYESTARGFNKWWEMWEEAREDPHCCCVFLGWWSKPSQQIGKDDPDFARYGEQPPTDKELVKIAEVKKRYDHEITPEQLAWIRRKMDPTAKREGDAPAEYEGSTTRMQEQPWCVAAGTRIGTDLGIIRIEDAASACFGSRGKILAHGITGQARIWKIRTKLGYEFRGTGNHPLITSDNEQVLLSDSLGAVIRLQVPRLYGGAYQELKWVEPPVESRIVITPVLARFVGLFMGDGSASGGARHHITEVSICCDSKDQDVIQECVDLFRCVFGVEASKNSYRGWTTVRSGQKHVFRTIKQLGLLRNDTGPTMRNVHVPEFIWRSPKEVAREFLRGLFEADGYNAYETNRVALFSKYPAFIKDVQLLLLSFGITSRSVVMQKKRAGDGHPYTGNQLELRTAEAIKFNQEIGFISARKNGRYDPVAYELRMSTGRNTKKKRPAIVFEDIVVEVVEEQTTEAVWNVTVEGDHLFDANGILTHNTEDEAFQQTGAIFFAPEKLTDQVNKHVSLKFSSYMYLVQDEFVYTQVLKAPNAKMVELKVWEPPASTGGSYVMGVDPAYGSRASNDRSSIQIFRCYADGLDQVAEYAWPLITTQHLAYVIASLLGWYGQDGNTIRYILELNGPGMAVYTALKSLRYQIDHAPGKQANEVKDRGLAEIFRNVKTYIYNRPDAMGPGFNYHFLTNVNLKMLIMQRLRDFVQNGMLHVRSLALLDEAKTVTQDKDSGSIEAPGSMKDDRVVAAALAVHCWEDRIKKDMLVQGRTREAEMARQRLSITDQVFLYQQNMLTEFFAAKSGARARQMRIDTRAGWRYR